MKKSDLRKMIREEILKKDDIKNTKRYMIYDDNTGKYFGESFTTIPATESRIEELEKTFGKSFYIIDKKTMKEV